MLNDYFVTVYGIFDDVVADLTLCHVSTIVGSIFYSFSWNVMDQAYR